MTQPRVNDSQSSKPMHIAVPALEYSYAELAEIYNQARVDYIVPMPMNARRMQEYVEHYDVSLEMSLVAIDPTDKLTNGIGMLGWREGRGWITRLGIIPERRRRRTGQYVMEKMLQNAQDGGAHLVQLEVIKGNEPAHRLFLKLGFEVTRELMIIRRPPGQLKEHQKPHDNMQVIEVNDPDTLAQWLSQREPGASWVEETASLLNIDKLKGLSIELPSGETGWVLFQSKAFQLTHLVLKPDCSDEMTDALIARVHTHHALQDTVIENVPLNHPSWERFQRYGYVEAFRRIEMFLHF